MTDSIMFCFTKHATNSFVTCNFDNEQSEQWDPFFFTLNSRFFFPLNSRYFFSLNSRVFFLLKFPIIP